MTQTGYTGVFLFSVQLICFLFLFLLGVFLAYVYWPYPQMRGVDAFGDSVRQEYAQIHAQASDSLKQRVRRTNQLVYQLLFVRTGWDAWLHKKQSRPMIDEPAFFDRFPLALRHASLLFSLRLALLWEQAFWFGLVLALAIVDGWAGWVRRRDTGAMESSFVCRHAGLTAMIITCLLLFVYPLTPWPVNHHVVFTVSIIFLGLAVRFFICHFRKYL